MVVEKALEARRRTLIKFKDSPSIEAKKNSTGECNMVSLWGRNETSEAHIYQWGRTQEGGVYYVACLKQQLINGIKPCQKQKCLLTEKETASPERRVPQKTVFSCGIIKNNKPVMFFIVKLHLESSIDHILMHTKGGGRHSSKNSNWEEAFFYCKPKIQHL